MSVLQARGGIPRVFRATIGTSGQKHSFPFQTFYIVARNVGSSNALRIFFTEDDFDNDANYVTLPVPATENPNGEWQGPVEAKEIWVKGVGGDGDLELVAFQRRG